MKKREMGSTPLDELAVLVSAYGTLDIVFGYGAEKGLTNSQCANLEALTTVLNRQFDQATEKIYQAVDIVLKGKKAFEATGD